MFIRSRSINIISARWWKISVRRSAVVYPGEWAVAREDVPDDDRLTMEIERTFGSDILNQVRGQYNVRDLLYYIMCTYCIMDIIQLQSTLQIPPLT